MGYGVAMHTRSYRYVTAEERETLSVGLAHGYSLRTMALILRRAPSTLSREVARNRTPDHPYRCLHCADQGCHPNSAAQAAAQTQGFLAGAVRADSSGARRLARADAGRLTREYPHDMQKQCSPETIYAALYVLPRGTLRSELLTMLGKPVRPVALGRRGWTAAASFPVSRRLPSALPTSPHAPYWGTGKVTSSKGIATARPWARW